MNEWILTPDRYLSKEEVGRPYRPHVAVRGCALVGLVTPCCSPPTARGDRQSVSVNVRKREQSPFGGALY